MRTFIRKKCVFKNIMKNLEKNLFLELCDFKMDNLKDEKMNFWYFS